MEDLQQKIIELMDLFDEGEVTTADKIDRPQRALDREAFDDFNKRNPMAGGGMLVQPSADGSRPGYAKVKSVKNVKDGINHILKYGTMHTDSIITNNKKTAQLFLNGVNSSIAMHNVSTQFADGGEFGFGGEIGISTNKLPPRGPVGINQLTSYKYLVSGKGIVRP